MRKMYLHGGFSYNKNDDNSWWRPYSQALYVINSLAKMLAENVEPENVVGVNFAKYVTVGSCVIVPYLFSSSSSADTSVGN